MTWSAKGFTYTVMGLCLAALLAASWSEFDKSIRLDWEAPVLFKTRLWLNPPSLDPKIKIFAYDDRAVAKFGTFDPPLRVWTKILQAIERSGATTISIDKLFDRPNYDQMAIDNFVTDTKVLTTPIITIAFVTPKQIPLRSPLQGRWSARSEKLVGSTQYAYGPNPKLESLTLASHAVYDGKAYVQPEYPTQDGGALPHLSLRVAGISGSDLLKRYPAKPQILVNFVDEQTLREQLYSMVPLIGYAMQDKAVPVIEPGDHVLILPAMYTGNTDWQSTPLGIVEGGFVLASMINSVFTNKWIVDVQATGFMVVTLFFIGWLVHRATMPQSVALGVAVLAIVIVGSTVLFVFTNIMLPFILPTAGFLAGFLGIASLRIQADHLNRQRMSQELKTAMMVQDNFIKKETLANVAVLHKSYEECGGDWWGHHVTESDIEIVCIADATGHGAPAALITAMGFSAFHSALESLVSDPKQIPSQLLEKMNRLMCQSYRSKKALPTAMTAMVVAIDRKKEELHLCSAGHVHPVLLSQNETRTIPVRGAPLGLTNKNPGFGSQTLKFPAGSRFVLMTDGAFEVTNSQGEFMRRSEVTKTIRARQSAPSEHLIDAIIKRRDEFSGGKPVEDDTTIIVIKH